MAFVCSKCNSEISSEVYDYSMKKYKEPLCITHQKDYSSNSKNQGLSEKESERRYGMIKGRIAEALIEELFLSLGYNVFRYGMENTVPEIRKLLAGVRGDVANDIRRMPDFVIQDKNRNVYFVEVKFRREGSFNKYDKSVKNYPYKNCYFIVVSKKHINCITYEELRSGQEVSLTSRNYLGDRKEFELDKEVIKEFCEFAVKFFKEV